MTNDDETRHFVADMLAQGHSEEDIFAALDKIHASGPEAYQPTQYGGAAPADLGPSTPANQRATMAADAEESRLASETDEPLPDGGTARQRELRAARNKSREDSETARGFASFALGGLAGMGAGSAASAMGAGPRVAGAVGGGVGGFAQAEADHAAPQDILLATLLGAGGGALAHTTGERTVAPPKTQAEIDSVGLAKTGSRMTLRGPKGGMFDSPEYRALPEGEHGTNVLAERAMKTADDALGARDTRASSALDAAERQAIRRNDGILANTDPLIGELRAIQAQQRGPGGPLNPEAHRRLDFWINQLSRGGKLNAVDFQELNAVRKAANDRLSRINGTDMGRAGDEQAAGMLSRAVRRFDEGNLPPPRGGAAPGRLALPPDEAVPVPVGHEMTGQETVRIDPRELQTGYRPRRFGDDLDAYAAEQNAIKEARGNLGEGAAAQSRVARVGSEDRFSPASSVADARQVERAGEQIPEARPLIDQIIARNIAKRRGGFAPPSLISGSAVRNIANVARHNIDNARFRLRPPKAVVDLDRAMLEPDMLGSIPTDSAPWGIEHAGPVQPINGQFIPLELQLMLMQDQEQR